MSLLYGGKLFKVLIHPKQKISIYPGFVVPNLYDFFVTLEAFTAVKLHKSTVQLDLSYKMQYLQSAFLELTALVEQKAQ